MPERDRGAKAVRRMPQPNRNFAVRREWDWCACRRLALWTVGGFVLVIGFAYATTQHFAALRLGYETELLREERARLAEERRRLLLVLAETGSPQAIEQAARAQGMEPARASQIDRAVTAPTWVGAASTFGR